MSSDFLEGFTENLFIETPQSSEVLVGQQDQLVLLEVAQQGPPGPKGDKGDKGDARTIALRMVTTPPILILNGQIALALMPLGDVVWNTALVYTDLQPSDIDQTGMLLGDRNYPIEEHVVRTSGSAVLFTSTPPRDGLYAVVSYLSAAS